MQTIDTYVPSLSDVEAASEKLKEVAAITPLMANVRYSKQFDCKVFLKEKIYNKNALIKLEVLTIKCLH